jgi:hypothetical protein
MMAATRAGDESGALLPLPFPLPPPLPAAKEDEVEEEEERERKERRQTEFSVLMRAAAPNSPSHTSFVSASRDDSSLAASLMITSPSPPSRSKPPGSTARRHRFDIAIISMGPATETTSGLVK